MSSDEYVLDTPVVRAFIAGVREAIAGGGLARRPPATRSGRVCRTARRPEPGSRTSSPRPFRAAAWAAGSASGSSTATEDGSLSLFSLVVPSGSATPIHDHLAWGLVGLYRGEQDEEIYAREGDELRLVERRALRAGDFYALFPPHDDIHRVRTTSAETSVSIHLLTNDTGCTWRHRLDPETGAGSPFRSGYANVACAGETAPPEGH